MAKVWWIFLRSLSMLALDLINIGNVAWRRRMVTGLPFEALNLQSGHIRTRMQPDRYLKYLIFVKNAIVSAGC